jgi:hypothetical protein
MKPSGSNKSSGKEAELLSVARGGRFGRLVEIGISTLQQAFALPVPPGWEKHLGASF